MASEIQTLAADALTFIASEVVEASCSLRYAGSLGQLDGTVSLAVCTGLQRNRMMTEEGLIDTADGTVTYMQTAEPSAWKLQDGEENAAITGQVVEILFGDETEWRRARVTGRTCRAGVVSLTVTSEFGIV